MDRLRSQLRERSFVCFFEWRVQIAERERLRSLAVCGRSQAGRERGEIAAEKKELRSFPFFN